MEFKHYLEKNLNVYKKKIIVQLKKKLQESNG